MKKRVIAVVFALALSGCWVLPPGIPYVIPIADSSNIAVGLGPGGNPVVINPFAPSVVVPGGILIGLPTLEGQWILMRQDGSRHCMTIQESRVAILIQDCDAGGIGQAASIREAPQAELAGPQLVLTVGYIGELFSTDVSTLTFTGLLQADGDFAGTLRIRMPNPATNDPSAPEEILVETPAVMARP